MRHVRAIAVLAATAALAVPAAAGAENNPTRVSAPSTATWVSPGQLNVELTVSCEEGLFSSVFVRVLQQQGLFNQAYGDGGTSAPCTGKHQRVAVSVWAFSPFGWQLGDAIMTVSACAFTCDTASRSIRIAL